MKNLLLGFLWGVVICITTGLIWSYYLYGLDTIHVVTPTCMEMLGIIAFATFYASSIFSLAFYYLLEDDKGQQQSNESEDAKEDDKGQQQSNESEDAK